MATSSKHIALFPLNIFLLPGEQMPLHIFEKRYQQLFDEMESIGISVALPFKDEKSGNQFASICELVRITKRYKSGERDVIVECKSLHWLESQESVFPGKLYPGGTIGDEVDFVRLLSTTTYLLSSLPTTSSRNMRAT
ncbi:MAG: hypothetical protein R2813_08015 [Flavobacteriales bacterium]